MRRIRAIVSGRVQGVSYRASTAKKAGQLGLVGWVRNLSNGNVELEAEGASAVIDALLEWCKQGPAAAQVDAIRIHELAPIGGDRFEIRY